MRYLLWEIGAIALAIISLYFGSKILRQSDAEFIADRERRAREIAKDKGMSEESTLKQFVAPIKVNTKSWRLYLGGRGIALGFVFLMIFLAIIIYDLNT